MYIKQVIIQGFRSYKHQTEIEPFSPRHNVIVGRNGSGKSNFFFAIQFVLSDEFSNLKPEERRQLLHEGTGPQVVSAYVEIIFDNSDSRIPIDKREVSLRRVVGLKKDNYYLDSKHVTKGDVMSLLEGAGFSHSNPYYIVKQGKINQLAVAPDAQRLKLLREVAGTRVYDERKEESLGILKESEGKQAQIEEMLSDIEQRLSTLEEEKEELKAYQQLDKTRRSLEYTIHDKELKTIRNKLEQLEDTRQDSSHGSRKLVERIKEAQANIESFERELKDTTASLATLKKEKDELQEENQKLIQQKAQLELSLDDLQQAATDEKNNREKNLNDLRKLEEEIKSKEAELASILPQFQSHKGKEERLSARLKACEQHRLELFAKEGRSLKFSSAEDRDTWLNREIMSLQQSAAQKEKQIQDFKQAISHLKSKIQQQSKDIREKTTGLEDIKETLERINGEYAQLKVQREDLSNERQEIWRKQSQISNSLQNTKDELLKHDRNERAVMGRAIGQGLDSVRRIVNEKHLTGVYGPLIDNFTCDRKIFTAVEVTAGNRLYNIIVDSDRTASRILSIMNQKKLDGEVTFLPLNKLIPPTGSYPDTREAVPLHEQLDYNPMFKKAIEVVFGRTLLCRDFDQASHYAKSARMDCITLEGDQVSRKGALVGGYYDSRTSKLELHNLIQECKRKISDQENESQTLKEQLDDIDGKMNQVLSGIQLCETRNLQLKENFERLKIDLRHLNTEHQVNQKSLGPKENHLVDQESELDSMRGSITALQAELGTELLSQLDTRDQRILENLGGEIQSLQKELRECLSHRAQLESQKNKIEISLSENLMLRREQLKMELEEIVLIDNEQQVNLLSTDLQQLSVKLDHMNTRMEEVSSELEDRTTQTTQLGKEIEKWKNTESEIQDQMNEESKSMDKLANKRSLLLRKKDDGVRKIRELGSLPSDAFVKYQHLTVSQLWNKLEKCNNDLKKYSHVNKKALDQFMTFSEQKETLTSRKEELELAFESIKELIDVLELRKYEAIEFTFKQMSKNFSEVFHELVPQGHGQLVMKKVTEEVHDLSMSDSQGSSAGPTPNSNEFTGISIRVSFTDQSSEMKELQQLSGGQKSLVALALIFAIQKCDPAPFYLFDEIDQALDSQHRHAVAAMIHKLSSNAQFITTTFRPELLETADKCYGVQFKNKVSLVSVITKERAQDFIETDK